MNPDPHPHWIGGRWTPGSGESLVSLDPSTGIPLWKGRAAGVEEIDDAVRAASGALSEWSGMPLEWRIEILERFAADLETEESARPFAELISTETGKPRWESLTEIGALRTKIHFSIEAYAERRRPDFRESGPTVAATRFKPHGVVAVLGPFNLPAHLPNAHIVPALLAGNTVVFKPSEQTPWVGRKLVECWTAAGLPAGVLNLVQGGRDTGETLVAHPGLNGVFFTGGYATGMAIAQALAGRPESILALEMGGNNPLIVWDPCPLKAALYGTLQSAFITAGQRCTCARRLIVPKGPWGDRFLDALCHATAKLVVGPPTASPEPFLGPLISAAAADSLLEAWRELVAAGGTPLVGLERIVDGAGSQGGALVRPGILDVTKVAKRPDRELFGPLLQVIRVPDFETAMLEANATAYGLSAGLFCDDRNRHETFLHQVRAGIVNWNHPITGASGAQPFGGVGHSGNHRPSGYYAADYCSYPVASIEAETATLPGSPPPGISL